MAKVRRWPGESIEDMLYRFQNKVEREKILQDAYATGGKRNTTRSHKRGQPKTKAK